MDGDSKTFSLNMLPFLLINKHKKIISEKIFKNFQITPKMLSW